MVNVGENRTLDLGRWAAAAAGERVLGRRLRSDSRAVDAGDVFVALGRGDRVGTHIAQALDRGAAVVLVDLEVVETGGASGDPRVRGVRGLRDVIGALADDYTGRPSADMTLVGVTGTNGKTSTVQLLAQSWDRLGITAASIGTLGAGLHGALVQTALTTPSVVEMHELLADLRAAGARAVGIELSSHALAQGRGDGCRFDIAAFTNLTRDHLDYHGSMDEYAAVKRRILTLRGIRAAVLNLDDPFVGSLVPPAGVRRVGVSTMRRGAAEVSAGDIRLRGDGADFTLDIDGERIEVRSPLIGRFNVDNIAMTAAILHAHGVRAADIATAVGDIARVPGRMQVVHAGGDGAPRVVVDYAHTPDGLQQALAAFASRAGRLVLVFGCRGDRDRGKRPEMARIAEVGADVVVLTDDDVHHEDGDAIIADVLAGFRRADAVHVDRDRASAIRDAIAAAGPDDTVLIAGKGHETSRLVGDEVVPFDDVRIAASALP
ncbi:UDP-N-acetylmuramoyl-L-alanyl-D-glutamate--2,6-diaminopimelate ligase [Microbacterium thalli]|uniref:UDP-N-acetylmuramyl-tripeptide synthetase n=1 Tax=Microbacterium thalli TaxID=3027921 RepID=A0ABT5SKW9_9MICO|nr:UDP-N-acetylmuramoyl-L-alanyl-D-glutamate--2,6-diaminopimelate ligase [Microbacterium thalli]MDD7963480.1 UDP-N-acetylmuramoyl-L-alanyl-D-glutamate--2,6-diaminopimelate ligase [Microbacterium thalli]